MCVRSLTRSETKFVRSPHSRSPTHYRTGPTFGRLQHMASFRVYVVMVNGERYESRLSLFETESEALSAAED